MESTVSINESKGLLSKEEGLLQSIFKDALKYTPSKLFGMIMNVVQVSIYTKILPPEQFGLVFISWAVISFIARIFSDWVGLSALRFFEEHHKLDNIKPYFTTFLFLVCTNLGMMLLSVTFFADYVKDFFNVSHDYMIGIILLIIPIAFRALLFQILRAQIKPFVYTVITVFNQITTIGLSYYFITTYHFGAVGVLMAMAVSITLIDFVMYFLTGMYKHIMPKMMDFKSLKQCYSYGLPIAASSIGVWIITESDKLILQHFHGSFYNGLVGTGFGLTYKILMPLASILTLAAIPRIINYYESGNDVRSIISKITGYYFVIFAPLVFVSVLMPKEIVLALSNEKYVDSAVFIPFLSISAFLMGLSEYTVVQYHLAKKTYIQTFIKLGPGIVGILVTLFLLPKFSGAHDILLLLGIVSIFSQGAYFLLTIFVRIRDMEWQIPYRHIVCSCIALVFSYMAIILFSQLFSYSPVQEFWLKLVLVLVVYALSFLGWNKVIKNIRV